MDVVEVVIDRRLGIAVSPLEVEAFLLSEGSMGMVPNAGDTDYESGASVDLTSPGERSMFAPLHDDEIF